MEHQKQKTILFVQKNHTEIQQVANSIYQITDLIIAGIMRE